MNKTRSPLSGAAVVAIVALVLTALGAFLVVGRSGGDSSEASDISGGKDMANVLPAMCSMQAAVDSGMASQAFNIFWDAVHTDAHVMAARLDAKDRSQGERFRQAKGFVERDLGTLSIVGLKQHVPALIVEARDAMRTLEIRGPDAPCP